MADEKNATGMSQEEKDLLNFQTEVAGVLRNQKKLIHDVFNQLSSDLRVELEDVRDLLRKNPLFDKQFTEAVRKGTDAVDNFLKEQVKIGTITIEQNRKLRASMKDVASQLEDSIDFWNKSSDAIRAGIREKQREADQYKKSTETSVKFLATQDKVIKASDELSKTEKELSDRRKIFNDYTQKIIPKTKEEIKQLEEQVRLYEQLGESTEDLNQQLAIQKKSLEEQIKTQNEELEMIRELQQARKEAQEDMEDNMEDLSDIRNKEYVKSREQVIEQGKLSNRMSEVMKSHAEGAWLKGENVMKSISEGLDGLSKRQTQRGKAMFGESLSGFMKEGRERIAGIQKDKALSGKGIGAKVTGGEKMGAMLKGLPNLMKGVAGSIGKILQGLLSKVFSAGIGFLIGKVISIASSIMKMLEPINKTMNIFGPFLNFFEIIFGTLGEMLDGVLKDAYAFRKEMTMSAGMAAKTATALQMAGDYTVLGKDATKDVRASWDAIVEYTNSYVTDLGKSNDEMNDSVVLVAKISKLTGISAQESASFVTQMTNGLEKSTAETNKMVVNLKTDAQSAGLNFKAVMSDVAKEGSRMAMYGEKVSTGIMKAAVRARELGGTIKTWTGLMDGFGDGWENVVGFATDFNRLAGAQVMDAFELKAAQVTGDVEKVQSVVVNAMKNVENEADLRGHLGKRFQKLLGIDDDEYAKLVERVHVEKVMAPALKNMNSLVSSMKGSSPLEKMFGIGEGDADRKRMLEKTYADWAKGMKEAGKDVNQELQVMQERAMVTAAQDAVKSGAFGSIEEFSKSLQSGSAKAADFFQKAMAQAVNFPDFKNMEEALEESMNPQERIEVMIKEIARDLFPGLLKLIAFIAEGLADVVDFVGGDSVAKEMRKVSGMFKVSASMAEAQGAGKDIAKMYKSEDMKKIFETYLPEGEKMAGIEDNEGLAAQLTMMQEKLKGKEDDSSKAALANIENMLGKINKKKTATQDTALFQNQANTGEIAQTEEDLTKVSGKMGQFAKTLDDNGGMIAKSGAALTTSYKGLVQIIEGDYVKGLKSLFTGLMEVAIVPVISVFKMLGTVLGGAWNLVKDLWNGLSKVVDGIIHFDIGKIFEGILDIVVAPFKSLWEIFSGLVTDIFGKAGESFIKYVEQLPGKLWDGLKGIVDGILGFFGGIFGGGDSKKSGSSPSSVGKGPKQAGDIAFGVGEVTHVMDSKKQVWKLDPQDRVVASTNFDFSRDNVPIGSALPKGSLMVSGEMSTSGKGGAGKFYKSDKVPADIGKLINEAISSQMKDTFAEIAPQGDPSGAGSHSLSPEAIEALKNSPDISSLKQKGMPGDDRVMQNGRFISQWMPQELYPNFGKYVAGRTVRSIFGIGGTSEFIKENEVGEDKVKQVLKEKGDGRTLSAFKPLVQVVIDIMKQWGYPVSKGARADYKYRLVRNTTKGTLSNHSFGSATDFRTEENPLDKSRKGKEVKTDMPPSMIHAIKMALGDKIYWGGLYGDAMHFELNNAADIAFSKDGGLKYLRDTGGNIYELASNEGAIITTSKVGYDSKLNAKKRNFMSAGGIYEKVATPPWWQQEAAKYKLDLGKYVEDINFTKLAGLVEAEKMAEFLLKSIGYSDQEIAALRSGGDVKKNLLHRLYNELMYGVDPNVKKEWRIKDIDWHKLNKASLGVSGGAGSGGASGGTGGAPVATIADIKGMIGINKKAGDINANNPQRNINPGNLRYYGEDSFAAKYGGTLGIEKGGAQSKKGDFAKFPNEEAGFMAMINLFKTPKYASKSVSDAMMIYAPPVENDTTKYIAQLQQWTGLDVSKTVNSLSDKELVALARGISIKEGYWSHTGVKPPMVNIADAYFGKGDVIGIMTRSGMYSPRRQDAVAVGTQLPEAQTNTTLKEGELASYLVKKQKGGGGSGQGGMQEEEVIAVMRQIASQMRRQNAPTVTKERNVYLDGMNTGRALQPNISGHGNNLNGG